MQGSTQAEDSTELRISQTQADHINGCTNIKPGDKVEVSRRMQRVVEVDPKSERLTIHKTGGMHSSIETVYAEAVTDYEPRD